MSKLHQSRLRRAVIFLRDDPPWLCFTCIILGLLVLGFLMLLMKLKGL